MGDKPDNPTPRRHLDDKLSQLREQLAAFRAKAVAAHDLEAELEVARSEQARLRQTVEALQTSLARYRELFDFAPIPCVALNRAGTIVSSNLAAGRLLAQPRRQIEGWPLMRFIADEAHDALLEHLRQCRKEAGAARAELLLRLGDATLPVEVHSHRRPGDTGLFLTTLTDISERRRIEDERRQWAEAEAVTRAKDQFLATLSHELRTPLSPIANLLAVLKMRKDLPAEIRPILEMMDRNLWLEVRLVDDLLDTTRIARGKLRLNLEQVDLHGVLREAEQMLQDRFRDAGVTLEIELEARAPRLQADRGRMLQVFWNLLGNAVKFTPSGGRVRLRSRDAEPGQVKVIVEDDGAGIESGQIERLFEPFEQVKDSHQGGLGLGLPIARGVVEAHGGRIAAYSDGPGNGSAFVVTLPSLESTGESTGVAPGSEPAGTARPT